jgi:hypothetical protein
MIARSLARRRFASLVVAALFGVVFGCGGGSDGGGMTPTTCVTFVSAGAATTFTVVPGSASCSTIEVRVLLNDALDVFGGQFVISFDPATVGYDELDAGNSHLASDGNSVIFQDGGPIPTGTGTVTIGFSRTGQVDGIDFDASQELCSMKFRKIAGSGSTALTLSNFFLKDPDLSTIPVVTASGGTFTIR